MEYALVNYSSFHIVNNSVHFGMVVQHSESVLKNTVLACFSKHNKLFISYCSFI